MTSKRRVRENRHPLLDELGHHPNRDVDKVKAFNGFFASAFNTDVGPWAPQTPVLEDCDWEDDKLPTSPELVGDLLLQLGAPESIGPGGIPARELDSWTMALQDRCGRYFSMVLGVWRGPDRLEAGKCCPRFQEG